LAYYPKQGLYLQKLLVEINLTMRADRFVTSVLSYLDLNYSDSAKSESNDLGNVWEVHGVSDSEN